MKTKLGLIFWLCLIVVFIANLGLVNPGYAQSNGLPQVWRFHTKTKTNTPVPATSTRTPTSTVTATPVVSGPDLAAVGMGISANTGGSCWGSNSALGLWVTVRNQGISNANAFNVTVNDKLTQRVTAGLAVGQSISLFFSGYNSISVNKAVVDSSNEIAEGNEANNTLSQQLPIPTQPVLCTSTPTP